MKLKLLILLCLTIFFAANTAKAQSCPSGQTEIDFVVIGANGGFSNYVLLQETTGGSSYFLNTISVIECIGDGLCYTVTIAGNAGFEVYQDGVLVSNPVDGDVICFPFVNSTYGCTDGSACNYDASANVDDGSCDLPSGCGDPLYLEYSSSVTCSDAATCIILIINGCTDTTACNYNTTANVDDGSCLFSSLSTYSQEACDSYIWNGNIYNLSGVYTFSTINANGCDSTATLNLTLNNSTTINNVETECDSYTWSVNGSDYNSSVIDTVIGVNASGCHETIILDLTINNSTISIENQLACNSYLWPINGLTYTTPSIVNLVSVNSVGCTQTNILNLTISGNPLATIFQNGIDLEVTISDTYFWSNSEITQIITPTTNGWYWCVVTDINGCIGDTVFYQVTNIVSAISEMLDAEARLVKITDLLGQEVIPKNLAKNTPLFYIYDDGTVEKRIVIE